MIIRPHPRLFIWGAKAWATRNGTLKLRCTVSSHPASSIESACRRGLTPAALTMTSGENPALATTSANREVAPFWPRSKENMPPSRWPSTASSLSRRRPTTKILAPASDRADAIKAPMPLPPPVINAVLSATSNRALPLLCSAKILARKIFAQTNISSTGMPLHAFKAGDAGSGLPNLAIGLSGHPLCGDNFHIFMD